MASASLVCLDERADPPAIEPIPHHEVGRPGHASGGSAAGKPFSDSWRADASRLAWSFMAKQLRE
jgi:hypothetical protein